MNPSSSYTEFQERDGASGMEWCSFIAANKEITYKYGYKTERLSLEMLFRLRFPLQDIEDDPFEGNLELSQDDRDS